MILPSKNIQSWPWQSKSWWPSAMGFGPRISAQRSHGDPKEPWFPCCLLAFPKRKTSWQLWDQRPCWSVWARSLHSNHHLGDGGYLCSGLISKEPSPAVYGCSLALHGNGAKSVLQQERLPEAWITWPATYMITPQPDKTFFYFFYIYINQFSVSCPYPFRFCSRGKRQSPQDSGHEEQQRSPELPADGRKGNLTAGLEIPN